MRIPFRSLLLILAITAVLSMTGCVGLPSFGGGLVVGQNYRLQSGETLNDDLTVIGGNATLEQDSTVNGDVAVIGGNVSADGLINGNISVLGGMVNLKDNAVVRGNVNQLGGSVYKSEKARVEGSNPFNQAPFRIPTMQTTPLNINFDAVFAPLLAFFRALALAALAILAALFAPASIARVGQAAHTQPAVTGGIGLLTAIVAPALLLVLGITIILLPLSLLGLLILGIAILYGWLALGLITGRYLGQWLNQNWSEPIHAGVGTLVLSLVASMANLIPCVGWLATFIVAVIGLGAVIVTQFGRQLYPAPVPTAPAAYRSPAVYPPYPPTPANYRAPETYEEEERHEDETPPAPPIL